MTCRVETAEKATQLHVTRTEVLVLDAKEDKDDNEELPDDLVADGKALEIKSMIDVEV